MEVLINHACFWVFSETTKMAKSSKNLALLGFLLVPLLYVCVLRRDADSVRLWKIQLHGMGKGASTNDDHKDSSIDREEHAEADAHFGEYLLLLRRLATGEAKRELKNNGVACVITPDSDLCMTSSSVRIATNSSQTTIYLTGNQTLNLPPSTTSITIKPYPRKQDPGAMSLTSPVRIVAATTDAPAPPCDSVHRSPAVVFSTGGFAGNFFHTVSEVLMPLFLTAGMLNRHVHLVVTDPNAWWLDRYRHVLAAFSEERPVVLAPPAAVHCFPGAVVGLGYHGDLACNVSMPPRGLSAVHFREFLHGALSLRTMPSPAPADVRPVFLLLSRRKSRVLLNEADVITMASGMGFRVEVATPDHMRELEGFAGLVRRCGVLVGVHGAGLTNMVFLPAGGVLLQVVPWGLQWVGEMYYGGPTRAMGLRYVEYRVAAGESTLHDKYPPDHPVMADPLSVHMQGYDVSKPIFIDGQNVTVDLARFRPALAEAFRLVPRPES